MAGDRADFWELPVDPATLEGLSGTAPRDTARTPAAERAHREAITVLGELVRGGLTERQRRLVEMYFFERKTEVEIARELGISQQAVSRQLFGVLRRGRRVGGAVQRLRKLCAERGVDPSRWV